MTFLAFHGSLRCSLSAIGLGRRASGDGGHHMASPEVSGAVLPAILFADQLIIVTPCARKAFEAYPLTRRREFKRFSLPSRHCGSRIIVSAGRSRRSSRPSARRGSPLASAGLDPMQRGGRALRRSHRFGEPIRRNVGSVEKRAASFGADVGFGVVFSMLAGALLIGAATWISASGDARKKCGGLRHRSHPTLYSLRSNRGGEASAARASVAYLVLKYASIVDPSFAVIRTPKH